MKGIKRVPDARLSSKVPHLKFDILVLRKRSPSCMRGTVRAVTHLDRLYVEANCYIGGVSINGIRGYSLTGTHSVSLKPPLQSSSRTLNDTVLIGGRRGEVPVTCTESSSTPRPVSRHHSTWPEQDSSADLSSRV